MRILLSVSIVAACIAVAPAGATAPATQASEPDQPSEKVICKRNRSGTYTGSNIRGTKRVCKTRSEWDRLERDAKDTFRRMDDTAIPRIPNDGRGGGGD